MRFAKIKMQGLAKAERHHRNRSHLKNRENPQNEKNNIVWNREGKTLNQLIREIKKEQEKRTGKKVRKDANVCVEFVFTFSKYKNPEAKEGEKEKSEFMRRFESDADFRKRWIKQNQEFLKSIFGAKNVLKFCVEFDEETPHIHAFVCPRDKKGNISFKSYVGNKHDIERMQDKYYGYMESLGLERGIRKEISKAFHIPLGRYYANEQKRAELKSEEIVREATEKAGKIIRAAQETASEILNESKETAEEILQEAANRSRGIADFVLSEDENEYDEFDFDI